MPVQLPLRLASIRCSAGGSGRSPRQLDVAHPTVSDAVATLQRRASSSAPGHPAIAARAHTSGTRRGRRARRLAAAHGARARAAAAGGQGDRLAPARRPDRAAPAAKERSRSRGCAQRAASSATTSTVHTPGDRTPVRCSTCRSPTPSAGSTAPSTSHGRPDHGGRAGQSVAIFWAGEEEPIFRAAIEGLVQGIGAVDDPLHRMVRDEAKRFEQLGVKLRTGRAGLLDDLLRAATSSPTTSSSSCSSSRRRATRRMPTRPASIS